MTLITDETNVQISLMNRRRLLLKKKAARLKSIGVEEATWWFTLLIWGAPTTGLWSKDEEQRRPSRHCLAALSEPPRRDHPVYHRRGAHQKIHTEREREVLWASPKTESEKFTPIGMMRNVIMKPHISVKTTPRQEVSGRVKR